MKLRKETRTIEAQLPTKGGEITRNVEKEKLVFDLVCIENGCEVKGGEVVFPLNHGRESDEALEAELQATYSHRCDEHAQ